ncbi:MAG: ATP-binding protein [Pseudorhodobacter sp.]
MQAILEALPLAAVLIDPEERIVAANRVALGLLGTEIVGRLYPNALRQAALQGVIERALQQGQDGHARFTQREAGAEIVFQVKVTPLTEGVLCIFEDVTGVEQVVRMRRDFVANVSHELRTPLTALLGFIETLRGAAKDDPAAQEKFLSIMEREAGRMNRLVGDLLSLSRVEAEESVRPGERVEMTGLLNRVVSDLRAVATAGGVEIGLDLPGGEVMVRADADQITQVMANLIENAVKYGGSGKVVRVGLSRVAQDATLRGPAIRIEVRDEGDGIDPIHLPRLTERFYRVDNHRSREKGGTGLGLAIVKHIVNRHRGRLKIESEKGRGAAFIVFLPDA